MRRLSIGLLLVLLLAACGEESQDRAGSGISQAALSITTTTLPDAQVGNAYSAMVATVDGKQPYNWSVGPGALPPGLALAPGTSSATISGVPGVAGVYDFVVVVWDGRNDKATANLRITVHPASNVTIVTAALPDASVGSSYQQLVTTNGGSQAGHVWAVSAGSLPPGLALTSAGLGAFVHGTPTILGSFHFTLHVTDSAGGTDARPFSINIHPPLVLSTQNLPGAAEGLAYAQPIIATGGVGPTYTWTIPAGALPPGLTITGNGMTANVHGTPIQPGFFSFTAQVEDTVGNVASLLYGINVLPTNPLSVVSASLPLGTAGVAYTAQLDAAGGNAPYTWTISQGVLPPGLSLLTAGAATYIDGTPVTSGAWSFDVQVTDAGARTAVAPLVIYVTSTTFSITNPASLPDIVEGYEFVLPLGTSHSVSSGSAWHVYDGSLPPGIELVEDTSLEAILAGIPTSTGTFQFTVVVEHTTTLIAGKTFTLNVLDTAGPLIIATQYLGECSNQFDLFARLEAAGGSGTGHVWSVAPGSALPAGLSLAAGIITGRPASSGPHSFRIQVTDSALSVATREYTVRLLAPMANTHVRERLVILLDASSSMMGSKMAVQRQEATNLIASLPEHYRFNLAAFGTQFGAPSYVSHFRGSSVMATAANRSAATNWIHGPILNPGTGGTPTYQALNGVILANSPGLKTLVLMTDGYPNSTGGTSQILADLPQWWSGMDDCHFIGVCIGGGGASFMQACAALLGGVYVAA